VTPRGAGLPSNEGMTPAYTLYGAEISYYTGKVRAYLRWKGLPFIEVPATAEVYREIIVPRVGFPVIPVVLTPDGQTLQDSTDILDALEARHGKPLVLPDTPRQRLAALLLELYGDEWLLLPAMHYRWHHNRAWAQREFGALSLPHGTAQEQEAAGERLARPFAQAAVLLGAEPTMHAAIERAYEALLAELDAHLAVYPYLLGTRPSIGDFGLFGPLYAHQYRDPASGALMRRLAPNVVRWVERMDKPDAPLAGDFLPADAVPDTLVPVLQRMAREQLPVLVDTARVLNDWLREHEGEPIPRALGKHRYALDGQSGERIVRPYSLWMLQRVQRARQALQGEDRERADAWLGSIGARSLIDFPPMPPLAREGLSVAVATA
jgi:glutathione S-transferase